MSSKPSVSFVIVNWNGKDVLRECLDSVYALRYPVREIVVVDNGSVDGSVEMVLRDDPSVTVIKNDRNMGLPIAKNQGMLQAVQNGADYLYALDNDLTIAPDAVDQAMRVMESDPKIAMVGSLIFNQDRPNVIFSAGHIINWSQNLVKTLGANEIFDGQFKDAWDVDYVGGGALLVRSAYVKKNGYFDESLIGYGYDDTEYGYRAKKLGYRVVCCANSHVWHRAHSGIGRYSFKKKYMETRNAVRFMKKHANVMNWCKYLSYLLPGFIYAFFKEGLKGNMPGVIGKFRGFIDGLRNKDDLMYELLEEKPKSS